MPEFSDYVESRPTATPDGTELLAASKNGDAVQLTTQQIADLGAGGGGVVQSIVAGANVSVDDTDPANPIVSASASGTVTSVTGTTDRITSSGGATPVLDIDAAYDAAITAEIAAAVSPKANTASPTFTGTPAAPTAAPATNSTQVATTGFVQQEITANSLSYTPADELTQVAGLSLENDITVLQLLQALEIPGRITIHANAAAGITLTNQPNSLQAFPSNETFAYTNANTMNIRRMRLIVRVYTASVSVNNPRMFIQYSLTAGASYVTLGLGTVVSGDAVSLLAQGVHMSNWITLPAEARDEDLRWRVVQDGGNDTSDPLIGNVYIEHTT